MCATTIQRAWRAYALRKRLARKLLEREDPAALLVCRAYLRGHEGDEVRAAVDRIGRGLHTRDCELAEAMRACALHEECIAAYDAVARRFALPSIDERYATDAFRVQGNE